MNIGILQCDHIRQALASQHGQYPEMFHALLKKADSSITLTTYNAQQICLPNHIDECDAYLITGSRHGVNDNLPWIAPLEHLIRQLHASNKKLIGICFGHQLIAKALGGVVIQSPKGWGLGISNNHITQIKPWMNPQQDQFKLPVSHQDQVTLLPDNAEILASNDFCPFYMVQIKNALTIQGHPEFSITYLQSVIKEDRKAILDPTQYEKALQSLNDKTDTLLIAQWMMNFITSSTR